MSHLQEATLSPSDTGSLGDTIQCGPMAPGVGRQGRLMGCINHPIAWLDGPDHKAGKRDPTTYPHIRQWQAFLWLTSQLTTNWITLNNRNLLMVLEVRIPKSISLGQNQCAGRSFLPQEAQCGNPFLPLPASGGCWCSVAPVSALWAHGRPSAACGRSPSTSFLIRPL